MMQRLDPTDTMHRLEAAVEEAREFFKVDPIWTIEIRAEGAGSGAARIDASRAYLKAPIGVDLDYYQHNPEKIRRDMAHEIAHLVTAEIWQVWRHLPEDVQGDDTVTGRLMRDALEAATVRLERLFMRERPEPSGGPAP